MISIIRNAAGAIRAGRLQFSLQESREPGRCNDAFLDLVGICPLRPGFPDNAGPAIRGRAQTHGIRDPEQA